MRRNVTDLADVAFRQRVLQGCADSDLTTTLFGRTLALPVILGPVGIAGMFRCRGETLAARAAIAAGIPFCLSTFSLCSLAEVAQDSHLWFQLYVIKDRSITRDLIESATALGVQALVFTVDMPVPGARYRDARSGMSGPPREAAPLRSGARPSSLGNRRRHSGPAAPTR